MLEINEVRLIGNLTRDPETFGDGVGAKFGLAVSRSWKNRDSGEYESEVCFIDVTCWRKVAEFAKGYLKKGTRVYLIGELKQENWQDKDTGGNRSKLTVTAHKIDFAAPKQETEQQSQPAPQVEGQDALSQMETADDLPF